MDVVLRHGKLMEILEELDRALERIKELEAEVARLRQEGS